MCYKNNNSDLELMFSPLKGAIYEENKPNFAGLKMDIDQSGEFLLNGGTLAGSSSSLQLGIIANNADTTNKGFTEDSVKIQSYNLSVAKMIYSVKNKSADYLRGLHFRVEKCGIAPIPGALNIPFVLGEKGNIYASNVQRCGSGWVCPYCALKISLQRQAETYEILKNAAKKGLKIFFVTLTIPHKINDEPFEIYNNIMSIWRKVAKKRDYTKFRLLTNVQYIRNMELTFGSNGFHPHFHIAFIFPNSNKRKHISNFLYALQKNYLTLLNELYKEYDYYTLKKYAINIQQSHNYKDLSNYVSKWDLAKELSAGNMRKGRTMFSHLLRDIENKKDTHKEIFIKYAQTFKGKRAISYSDQISKFFDVQIMDETEILKDDKILNILYLMGLNDFKKLHQVEKYPQFLNLLYKKQYNKINKFLAENIYN